MFKNLKNKESKTLNYSGRSYVGETSQIEGDIRTEGAIDVAGLINGNVYVNEMTVEETGSIRGNLEVSKLEVNGHVEGKIIAGTIILGKSAIIKGDIFFRNSLKADEGSDIEGYIKRTGNEKTYSDEDIAIEEITQRPEKKEKVAQQINANTGATKEAV